MYDIIGDVHGHATLLKNLLLSMGYVKSRSGYFHPERKAVFVGDFVNRGPEIRQSVELIRKMTEGGMRWRFWETTKSTPSCITSNGKRKPRCSIKWEKDTSPWKKPSFNSKISRRSGNHTGNGCGRFLYSLNWMVCGWSMPAGPPAISRC